MSVPGQVLLLQWWRLLYLLSVIPIRSILVSLRPSSCRSTEVIIHLSCPIFSLKFLIKVHFNLTHCNVVFISIWLREMNSLLWIICYLRSYINYFKRSSKVSMHLLRLSICLNLNFINPRNEKDSLKDFMYLTIRFTTLIVNPFVPYMFQS
jgi:hypothetical protein